MDINIFLFQGSTESISLQLGGGYNIPLLFSSNISQDYLRSYKTSQLYVVVHYMECYKLFWIYFEYTLDIAWKLFINL